MIDAEELVHLDAGDPVLLDAEELVHLDAVEAVLLDACTDDGGLRDAGIGNNVIGSRKHQRLSFALDSYQCCL